MTTDSSDAPAAAGSGGASSGKDLRLEAIRNKIEGPTPNQSLAEYLNRTHVTPVIRKCCLQKDHKVSYKDKFLYISSRRKCLLHHTYCRRRQWK